MAARSSISALRRLTAAAAILAAVGAGAQAPPVVGLSIPVAPAAVTGTDGATHLAFELHITARAASVVERVEVLAGDDAAPLVSYSGSELDDRVMRPGAERRARYGRSLAAGARAVVHVWVTLKGGQRVPRSLRSRLVAADDAGRSEFVEATTPINPAPAIVLGPPFRAGTWMAHNGPGNHRAAHWGSILPGEQPRATIPQRYAIDFIGLDAAGHGVRGDVQRSTNADWTGFGAEVIAVADGVVREMRDGAADNSPLVELPPPADLTAAGTYGNYAVIELRGGTFAHYAHLQQNSLRVRTGDRVKRGQVLGRLGNSGNTNGAHLHFNITHALAVDASEGLPFVFESFDYLGQTTVDRAIGGDEGGPAPAPGRRRQQLPLDGAVIRFR